MWSNGLEDGLIWRGKQVVEGWLRSNGVGFFYLGLFSVINYKYEKGPSALSYPVVVDSDPISDTFHLNPSKT